MVLLLHGAQKNVGDFLILDRGGRLLSHAHPAVSVSTHLRMEPVRSSDEPVVVCGGPALQRELVPRVVRFERNLAELPRIYGLALGWGGEPTGHPEALRFNDASIALLEAMTRHASISVRDDVSARILGGAGIEEVRRTGCVAWYDLASLGSGVHRPLNIEKVVVTTPARPRNTRTALHLLRLTARRFPKAERTCVFHRGITSRAHASTKARVANGVIAAGAGSLGFKIVDAAGRLDRIDFYREADLHVGFRVHAHLAFLSYRRPSILISEDGRGTGQAETLHDPYRIVADGDDVIDEVSAALDAETRSFDGTVRAVDEIEATWPTMQAALGEIRG